MNIAMIQSTPYPPEEGIGNYVSNLSRELLGRGHNIYIITRGYLKQEITTHNRIQIVRVPCPPLYPFHVDIHGVFARRFLNRIEDQLDVIHAHTPLTPPIETSTPLVSTVHTSVVEDIEHVHGRNLRSLMSKLTVAVSSKRHVANQIDAADRITTVSSRVSNELENYYGVNSATVTGNGVDIDMFRPGDEREGEFVLFVGRLDYPKGLFDLVDAAERVVEKHDIEFVIAGKGPLRNQIERQAKRQGIADSVRFTGFISRERQIRLYQNAAAFVLPSHYEGLPTVLLEAMACGSPVVSTTVGGCPDVIDDEVNGLLVPPGDPSALADALDTVLSDSELRARIGSNARDTVVNRYTWDTIADRYEREYRLAGAES